jgi:hypothetical protein
LESYSQKVASIDSVCESQQTFNKEELQFCIASPCARPGQKLSELNILRQQWVH